MQEYLYYKFKLKQCGLSRLKWTQSASRFASSSPTGSVTKTSSAATSIYIQQSMSIELDARAFEIYFSIHIHHQMAPQ